MWSSVEDAVAAFRGGGLVIVVDDENRENEGDLVASAQHMTTDQMAFIVRHSSGVVCAAMYSARLDALQLPLMCPTEIASRAPRSLSPPIFGTASRPASPQPIAPPLCGLWHGVDLQVQRGQIHAVIGP